MAAMGQLMPPKVMTAFNPDMNGYYDGKGKIIYTDDPHMTANGSKLHRFCQLEW